MQTLYLIALFTLAVLAVAATLHPAFDDNLTQRTGLGLIGVGSSAEALNLLQFSWSPETAHMLLVLGCAVYGLGTGFKTWSYRDKK